MNVIPILRSDNSISAACQKHEEEETQPKQTEKTKIKLKLKIENKQWRSIVVIQLSSV
jgi:hypothetical protein